MAKVAQPINPMLVMKAKQWLWAVLVALLVCLSLTTSANAKSLIAPVQLSSEGNYHEYLAGQVTFALDPSLEKSAEEMASRTSSFKKMDTPYIDAGMTQARVWLHFAAINPESETGVWRLDIQRQYIKELRVYIIRDGVIEEVLFHANTQPFQARAIPSRFQQANFAMEPSEKVEFLIGYRSSSTTFLPVHLGMADAATQEHAQEAFIDWLINGALLAMVILALLLIPVIGWRLGASFALYIIAGIFYVANADGYAFQYIWPDSPWLNDRMNLASMLLMPAAGINFARQLFRFSQITPRFDRFLTLFLCGIGLAFLGAVPLFDVPGFMVSAYSLVPIAALLQLICGGVAFANNRVGSVPFIIGALLVVSSFVYATTAHLVPGQFNLDLTLDYGHFTLFTECIAFAVAILLRILAIRDERDSAQSAALAAANEQLRLNAELIQSQQNYAEAKQLSDTRLNQLSDVSHDIRQPLLSLRASLGKIRGQNEQVTDQMQAAFDYLEGIARTQSEAASLVNADSAPAVASEEFPVRVVLDNVHEIFRHEAKQLGKQLRYRPSLAVVTSDPVALMRIVSNLVANALKHGGDRVLLASRQRGDSVRIEVWDNGDGLSEAERERALHRGQTSGASPGEGLGLAIVAETAAKLGLSFELRSRKGAGTVALIALPNSQPTSL